jgi:hypothetical protein
MMVSCPPPPVTIAEWITPVRSMVSLPSFVSTARDTIGATGQVTV